MTASPQQPRRSAVAEFFAGVRIFLRGFGMWSRRPGLMGLGALPALIVSIVYIGAFILLMLNAGAIADRIVPFAAGWPEPWSTLVHLLVTFAVVAAGVALGVFTFAAVTLMVATPFIERISLRTEREFGGIAHPVETAFWPSVRRGIADAARLIGVGILTALTVFVLGLIPVIGSVVGWIAGAFFGGRALAIELTGTPGDARGIPLRERQRLLAASRARSLGFGVCAYLMFLIPLGAVVGTPAAAVGGTILLRELVGEPTRALGTRPPQGADAAPASPSDEPGDSSATGQ